MEQQSNNYSKSSGKMELKISDWLPDDLSSVQNAYRHIVKTGGEQVIYLKANFIELIERYSSDLEAVEWLSPIGLFYITLVVLIVTSSVVISANLYRKIRYAIPARVNCWFCNTNTKVLYSLRETWTCPTCQQYNGFTPDGHYNKRIPAQFMEALNRPIRGCPAKGYQPKQTSSSSNGLCSQCNLNQVLKVFQLASFVPVNERNFDAEIEAEQKRLEALYDICDQCKVTVRRCLSKTPSSSPGADNLKVKVNRVTPTLSSRRLNHQDTDFADTSFEPDLAKLHEELQRNNCDNSDSSRNSFLSLNNLNIGSRHRKHEKKPDNTFPHGCSSPSATLRPPASPLYNRNSVRYSSHGEISQDSPIWKDYPLVQGRISPTYSVVDSMSVPVGQPAFATFSSVQSQFNYQSSNLGGVFGGRKPVISPPKFSNSSTPSFAPHLRYGPYYEVTSMPMTIAPPSTVVFSSHSFPNPISRSSSQSSGFVSQHGSPMPPQSPVQHLPTSPRYSPGQ